MFPFDGSEPQQHYEYPRLDDLEQQERRVKCNTEPCRRGICIGVPVHVEVAEIEYANSRGNARDYGQHEQPDLHSASVELSRLLMQHSVRDVAEHEENDADSRHHEVG